MRGLIHGFWRRGMPLASKGMGDAGKPAVERLEARRMLSLTVSASTLAGPKTAGGTIWDYETMGAGLFETNTQRVIGAAKFNGQNAVEVDSTGNNAAADVTTSLKSYNALTGAGLLAYGNTGTTYVSGKATNETTTYSPTEVILPVSMTSGKSYTEATTWTEIETGESNAKLVVKQTELLSLEPAMQTVTVPAGKYKCYVVDETIVTSSTLYIAGIKPISSGPNSSSGKVYYAPSVGVVEAAIGTSTTELTGFSGKGAWNLSGAITGTLPKTTVKAGAKVAIAAKLTIVNSGKTALSGKLTINYFLAKGTIVDSTSIALPGSVSSLVTLAAGKSTAFNFNLTTIPSVTSTGNFHIIAQIIDPSGSESYIDTSSTFSVTHS